jgi:AAHS family 4-hydroxybenzoate transporter-like MFS transporter
MRFRKSRLYISVVPPALVGFGIGILSAIMGVGGGFMLVPAMLFLPFVVLGSLLISGAHFGILSIAGIFYPSAIRASGGGWATSVAKVGAILGPIVGAAVLSSGMPVIQSYALLAICPAVLFLCAIGIAAAVHRRPRAEVLPVAPLPAS